MATESNESEIDEPVDSEGSVNEDLTAPLVSAERPDSMDSASKPWWRLLTVEPSLLLLSVAVLMTGPVDTTLYLTHTCRHMGYNETTCSKLEENGTEQLETLVQTQANKWVMTHLLVESFVPALLTMFAGPWSDQHGRKTFLLLPIMGYAGKFAGLAAVSHWPALAPYWLLTTAVPASLGGGFVLAISMCFCYVSDVSTPQRRGFRMGVVEAAFYVGVLAGSLTSTHLFHAGGYIASYATATGLCVLSALYTAFVMADSITNRETGSWFLAGLADWRLVASMFNTCCRGRLGNRRPILWLSISALALSILSLYGETGVGFLFVRRKFEWDIEKYTTYSAASIVMQIICSVLGVWVLSLRRRPDDSALAVLAFVPKACAGVMLAVSPSPGWMYGAAAVGSFGALGGPLCRAVISKSVSTKDVGKAFSLVSALEAVTPLAAAPLYTLVYNATLVAFPGAFYLLSASIFAINALIFSMILCLQDKNVSIDTAPVNAD